ncbi:Zinc finger mym-type protein 1-like protein [Oopsacas minuta]|uniref:Zinc finger mym-type protein 1-like protein n=1 Tax=Oopsacas minuta TaxID=111878 RepID=A0AAV7K0G5_9METZ|nr:Zinc finger mym-type protein 1-like protein [Oopsacas minuta]
MLSDQNENIKKENRHYFGAVVDVVSLCCKQAMALRGHRESDEEASHVNKRNFLTILDLVTRHDPIVARRLQEGPQNAKYMHDSIQDNVIHAAAELIREQIAAEKNGNYYAIIADESRDTGHKEQRSLMLRYIVQEVGIHGKNVIKESFLAFAACGSLSAVGLWETVQTSLRDCKIDLLGCVAQCFDGAVVMSGRCTGVQARILIVDVVHDTARAEDLFTLLQSLHYFLSSSIVHELYVKLRGPAFLIPNLARYPLSDTHWVCRHDACETLSATLPVVIDVLEDLIKVSGERGATARRMMT